MPPLRATGSEAMLSKIVILFLVFIAVLGMFGKLKLLLPKRAQRLAASRCKNCGRFRIGKDPCPCGKG